MENQMMLTVETSLYRRVGESLRRLSEVTSRIARADVRRFAFTLRRPMKWLKILYRRLSRPMHLLRRYYSLVLEREVTMRETRLLTEAQLAVFLFIFPAECPVALRLAALLWCAVALKKCKTLPPVGRE